MTDVQDIGSLLIQVSAISKKYDEIARQSGHDFNIFQILGVESDELSHSRMLASLLDPDGLHGKGDLFLRLFLETAGIHNFNTTSAAVTTEKYIGRVDFEQDTGGRIDIVITGKNSQRPIIIENKIYAEDQGKQLVRYRNAYKNPILLYLTPDGNEASKQSAGAGKVKYTPVSYQSHICRWLE